MSFTKTALRSREVPQVEKRSGQQFGDSSIPPSGSLSPSFSGVPVNETTVMQVATVLSCVGLITDAISTLPWDAYRKERGKRVLVDPVPQLIEQPFAEIETNEWISQYVYSMLLRGNFYGLIVERDKFGYAQQIQPIHPDTVNVRYDQRTKKVIYRVNMTDRASEDIMHIRGLTPTGSLVGMNPIQAMRYTIGLAMAAERFGIQFFVNGAVASGTVSTPADLSYEQTLVLARQFAADHAGLYNAHLPVVLTNGAEWNQLSIAPDDAQFLQTRGFQKTEIYGIFRVPPHKLGDTDKTTSWGTGIESQEISFWRDALRPPVFKLEKAMSRQMPENEYVKMNPGERLRGDTLQRYQAYTLARNGGWMNIDEIREFEDKEPLPDGLGQDYWAPLNFAPIKDLDALNPAAPSDKMPVDQGADPNAS